MNYYDLTTDQKDKVIELLNDKYITRRGLEYQYQEMLDDCYGEIAICGYQYSASHALERIDPIAYNCGFADFSADYIEIGDYYYSPDDVDEAIEQVMEEEA